MTSYSISMDYESLSTVLLYTDPNLRFKMAQRIPKIRHTEKIVPLRIESLSLNETETVINRQSYRLGIYRLYHMEEIPLKIKYHNNRGGVSCDLDQYGFEIPNSFDPILNGDVSFRSGNVARRTDTEEMEWRYQNGLRVYEEALAKINQLELEGTTVKEFLAGPMTNENKRFGYILRLSKEAIQAYVNEYRTNLIPFDCQRNDRSPPITAFIQLTINRGYATTIQRYEYNHELCEAVKKFNCEHFDGIWRIPVGFKIAAHSVYGENAQMVPISSVLDSSKNLRKLSVSVTSELVSDFQHSFVRNAEILSIHSVKREIGWLATALETIENRQIHIELIDFENPVPNEYFQLIQGWASMKRSVGSLITFELRTDEIGEGILELLRARNERTGSTDRCVPVLQSDSTILEVFYCGINIENSSELLLTAMIMEA